jgi:RluA family pseudouridine synthase
MNIPVVYEDDWLLVANKPSGLLVIPTPKKESRTLTSILGLHPCHRLDRETSGLIIYAKGKSVRDKMMEAFKSRKVKKTYIAFVQGRLPVKGGRIEFPIEGKRALTCYQVIQQNRDFSVVKIEPLTGRTNQIRIHFKAIGHPLVGESRFAYRRDFHLKAKRVCLHAQELDFLHPVTGKPLHLHCGLSNDLKEFLSKQGLTHE